MAELADPALKPLLAFETLPHCLEIGIKVISISRSVAVMRLPYSERLVGNARTGVVHGGVITTVMDTTGGLVAMAAQDPIVAVATLDLRIDYLKPATPGEAIVGRAECYKTTQNVAFVRGTAYHTDPDDPIAHCAATFMVLRELGAVTDGETT